MNYNKTILFVIFFLNFLSFNAYTMPESEFRQARATLRELKMQAFRWSEVEIDENIKQVLSSKKSVEFDEKVYIFWLKTLIQEKLNYYQNLISQGNSSEILKKGILQIGLGIAGFCFVLFVYKKLYKASNTEYEQTIKKLRSEGCFTYHYSGNVSIRYPVFQISPDEIKSSAYHLLSLRSLAELAVFLQVAGTITALYSFVKAWENIQDYLHPEEYHEKFFLIKQRVELIETQK